MFDVAALQNISAATFWGAAAFCVAAGLLFCAIKLVPVYARRLERELAAKPIVFESNLPGNRRVSDDQEGLSRAIADHINSDLRREVTEIVKQVIKELFADMPNSIRQVIGDVAVHKVMGSESMRLYHVRQDERFKAVEKRLDGHDRTFIELKHELTVAGEAIIKRVDAGHKDVKTSLDALVQTIIDGNEAAAAAKA